MKLVTELAKVKLELAKEELDKQVHDKQLVRILKCSDSFTHQAT